MLLPGKVPRPTRRQVMHRVGQLALAAASALLLAACNDNGNQQRPRQPGY